MENFNFTDPAELFVGGGRFSNRFPMFYRRFATAAEAVRYAIELQRPDMLVATVVETDVARYDATDIRGLYDSDAYPLSRRLTS